LTRSTSSPATVDPLHDDLSALHRATTDDPTLREAVARVEAGLQQARLAAEGAKRTRVAFLANMSHELRTPLNAILGFSQLLRQDRKLAPEQLTHVEIIQRSGEQLLTLINDVLELSRQDADESRAGANFDLLQLVDDLEDMLYLRAERRGLRLRVCRDPHLPRQIRVDGPRLRELFLLLLGNAIKFASPGELGLTSPSSTTRRGRPPARSCAAILAIPGLGTARPRGLRPQHRRPASCRPRMHRRDPRSRRSSRVRSRRRASTSPTASCACDLPVGCRRAREAPTMHPSRAIVGLAPGQPTYRILVAEDRWQSRQLLVQMLARVGFDVREASDGAEAIELWQQLATRS
jgi:CheY-like chemotaxis protein